MKLKYAVMLAPALALGFLAVSAEAQQHKATRLGNPATRFAKKPPKKADDARVLLRSDAMKADVAEVLRQTGWKGNAEDFDRAVASAEITEVQIAPGTRIPFMSSRERNKKHTPHALMDVLWAGRKPIEAYAFNMTSNCVNYRIVIPKACGNFWFEETGKDTTSKECAPPPPPPVVSVSSPGEACVTQPVEIAVNVQNPPADGKVAVSVNGKELMAGALSGGTFRATFPGAKEPGTYEVTASSGGVTGRTSVTVKPCIPTCGITVTPNPAHAGKPITVDVSGSRVAAGVQGGIKTAKVEVVDPKGQVTGTYELAAPNFVNNAVVIKKSRDPHRARGRRGRGEPDLDERLPGAGRRQGRHPDLRGRLRRQGAPHARRRFRPHRPPGAVHGVLALRPAGRVRGRLPAEDRRQRRVRGRRRREVPLPATTTARRTRRCSATRRSTAC